MGTEQTRWGASSKRSRSSKRPRVEGPLVAQELPDSLPPCLAPEEEREDIIHKPGHPVVTTISVERQLKVQYVQPPFEAMVRPMVDEQYHGPGTVPDIAMPDVSQHSLMEAREVAVGEPLEYQRKIETLDKAKLVVETGRR